MSAPEAAIDWMRALTPVAAALTAVVAFRVTAQGTDQGHFLPFPGAHEGRLFLIGENGMRLDVQIADKKTLAAVLAHHDRFTFAGEVLAVTPASPAAGRDPHGKGGGGKVEATSEESKRLAAIALMFATELRALLDLMARMESDVPEADRATDEEWLDRTASATEVLSSGLAAMRKESGASGLAAEGIDSDLKVAAWAPTTTALSSRESRA
ncbi:hypothetical protein SNE35_22725 [Paucibacter sp. R3-3]|uniref:PH domain-containing protein n=1 Tax=Roseateles agri TaxID=3098619 RepID=A0ABU5DM08_9BURK|nr:hypothetical protein [Paucibacter sp. R3-3]MDY0747335.1 hypothetical protein [Paucibacter sp. R3-3]